VRGLAHDAVGGHQFGGLRPVFQRGRVFLDGRLLAPVLRAVLRAKAAGQLHIRLGLALGKLGHQHLGAVLRVSGLLHAACIARPGAFQRLLVDVHTRGEFKRAPGAGLGVEAAVLRQGGTGQRRQCQGRRSLDEVAA
jgi:hypothetical protein